VIDGAGDVVSFDPQSPGAPKPTQLLSAPGVSVACPTASECVAVDSSGMRATFNPQTAAQPSTATIDSVQPMALQCMGPTYCVILDSAGRSVEFDPHGGGSGAVARIGSGASLTDFACAAPATCVAVDSAGYGFGGSGTLPQLPVAVAGPRISGAARALATLTTSGGSWTNAPTSVMTQWQRCAASGARCTDIAGATTLHYKPAAADAGHVLRVWVEAANEGGYGSPVTSAPTPVIQGLPAPPAVHAVLWAPSKGPARIVLSLTSAKYGPKLQLLTLSLPSGVSFTAKRGAVEATSLGRRLGVSARVSHHHPVLRLVRAAGQVQLVLRGPGLRLGSSLQRALAHRPHQRLLIVVTVQASGHSYSTRTQVVEKR
jgi:hypothetical protein